MLLFSQLDVWLVIGHFNIIRNLNGLSHADILSSVVVAVGGALSPTILSVAAAAPRVRCLLGGAASFALASDVSGEGFLQVQKPGVFAEEATVPSVQSTPDLSANGSIPQAMGQMCLAQPASEPRPLCPTSH